jgi:hypothetical protein
MYQSNDQREVILARLAEIRALIKKSDDTLRTARDLEGHLTTVLREVGARLRRPGGTGSLPRLQSGSGPATLDNSPPCQGGVRGG